MSYAKSWHENNDNGKCGFLWKGDEKVALFGWRIPPQKFNAIRL
jgi:hypothetical protein